MKKVPWSEITKAEFIYSVAGPIAKHNYLCAVCREKSAVLDLGTGILQPCWECYEKYRVVKLNWIKRLLEKLK